MCVCRGAGLGPRLGTVPSQGPPSERPALRGLPRCGPPLWHVGRQTGCGRAARPGQGPRWRLWAAAALAVTGGVPCPSGILPCSLWRVDESLLLGAQHPFLIAELVNQAVVLLRLLTRETKWPCRTRGGVLGSAWAAGLQTGPGAPPDTPARRAGPAPTLLSLEPLGSRRLCHLGPPAGWVLAGHRQCPVVGESAPSVRTNASSPACERRPKPARAWGERAGRWEPGVCGDTVCPLHLSPPRPSVLLLADPTGNTRVSPGAAAPLSSHTWRSELMHPEESQGDAVCSGPRAAGAETPFAFSSPRARASVR